MKKWYLSKTLWVNCIATVAIILQSVTGHEIINADQQLIFLGVINFILRLITNEGLTK